MSYILQILTKKHTIFDFWYRILKRHFRTHSMLNSWKLKAEWTQMKMNYTMNKLSDHEKNKEINQIYRILRTCSFVYNINVKNLNIIWSCAIELKFMIKYLNDLANLNFSSENNFIEKKQRTKLCFVLDLR